jgi:MFS family permease
MAATFYQAAFAALTRWYRSGRVRALTTLTLAGGLASTVFAPVTATLAAAIGWRHTLLTLSVVLSLIVTPLHWFGLRGPWPSIDSTRSDGTDESYDSDDSDHLDDSADVRAHPSPRATEGTPPAVTRSRPFWVLTAALTLSGFALYAVVFNLIPLLLDRGASPAQAAWALGLGGVGQTIGRLLYSPIAHRTTPARRTAVLILTGGATTLAIALIPGPLWLLTVGAMVAGMVRGNLTLLQATAVTDRWGTNHYARLMAILSAPVTIAAALAPWAGSLIADQLNSYGRLFITLTAISAVAAVLAVAVPTRRLPGSKHAS